MDPRIDSSGLYFGVENLTMKSVKMLVVLPFCFSLLLSACNSKSDVKHLTQEEMQEYVQDRIGEKVELVSTTGDESGNGQMKYIFNIVERDIDFEVTAQKWADGIDGARFGNYKLVIHVKYENGVVKHYKNESEKLAEEYSVEYEVSEYGGGATRTGSYMDIDNLTEFIIGLDRLYAFEITKKFLDYPSVGTIRFSETGGRVSGLEFSHDSKKRLNHEDLKYEIATTYLRRLKQEGLTDSTVPQDAWDKYGPKN
jgi:hypothetical protein